MSGSPGRDAITATALPFALASLMLAFSGGIATAAPPDHSNGQGHGYGREQFNPSDLDVKGGPPAQSEQVEVVHDIQVDVQGAVGQSDVLADSPAVLDLSEELPQSTVSTPSQVVETVPLQAQPAPQPASSAPEVQSPPRPVVTPNQVVETVPKAQPAPRQPLPAPASEVQSPPRPVVTPNQVVETVPQAQPAPRQPSTVSSAPETAASESSVQAVGEIEVSISSREVAGIDPAALPEVSGDFMGEDGFSPLFLLTAFGLLAVVAAAEGTRPRGNKRSGMATA